MTISSRLRELGVVLPEIGPRGTYSIGTVIADQVFVSGQGPIGSGMSTLTGVVGEDVSVDEAKSGARMTAVNLLAAAATATGSVDRVSSVLSLTVYVRAHGDFTDHSVVADGCSEFFQEVFGEKGLAARAAIGVASLPFGLALEAAAVFGLKSTRTDPATN